MTGDSTPIEDGPISKDKPWIRGWYSKKNFSAVNSESDWQKGIFIEAASIQSIDGDTLIIKHSRDVFVLEQDSDQDE